MPAPVSRPQKVTLAEMRSAGVRGLLIYCSDYHRSHWTAINGDHWPDDIRLLILSRGLIAELVEAGEPRCGRIGKV
jgi:hypothetical protein